MPGTGHSSRYKGSISNRNSKPAFQVLAPWNSKKNGNINQVPVSSGGEAVNFKLMNAKMMSNYNKNTDEFTFDCSLNVLGNKVVSGTTTFNGKVICRDNVDICGNLTIDGVLTAQTALIQDLSAINITDVCDNVLTLGNHESFSTQHMRGIFMSHIGNFTDEFSFMGFDPCGNECLGGPVNDSHGQFVFLTDASFNSQANASQCNITGEAGRVVVGTLDISGSSRYGDGVGNSGAPTQNVTGQADSSMHLVGRTIIAQKGLNSAQLDISGGIDVVGPSKLTDLSGAYIDISGGNIDIAGATSNKISLVANGNILLNSNDGTSSNIEIHNKQGDSANAIALTATAGGVDIDAETGVTIDASGASNFTTSAGILTLDGATGVDISGNAGTVNITTTGTVDINAGTTTMNSTSTTAITGGTGTTVTATTGALKLTDGSGANINIASGLIHLDVSSNVLNPSQGQIKLTDGSGAYIDMSGGRIDISGDDVTITGSSGSSLNLKGQRINIGEEGSIIDMSGTVQIDAGHIVIKDISATNIDISSNLNVDGVSALAITTIGGTLDITGATTATTVTASGAVQGGSLTDGVANLTLGALTSVTDISANNISATATIDTNKIIIGDDGITLDGAAIVGSVGHATFDVGNGNYQSVTINRNCGLFDISGTLLAGASTSRFTILKNNKILANNGNYVFAQMVYNRIADAGVALIFEFNTSSSFGVLNVKIKNIGTATYTSSSASTMDSIQFMIINPST